MATRTLRLFYEIVARDQTGRGASSAAGNAGKVKSAWESLRDSTARGLEVGDRLANFGGRLQGFGRDTRKAAFDLASAASDASLAQAEVATLGALSRDEIKQLVAAQSEQFGQGYDAQVKQAKGLYAAVSAGATTAADATDLLTAANRLSIGGLAELEPTVVAVSKATSNYGTQGVTAARAADVFFGTVRDGQLTIDELSRAFPRVAATAAFAGVKFEEANAAIAVLSKTQGSAAEGASGLKAALSNILKPTKDAKDEAKRARRVYKDLNFSKAGIEAKGLTGFIHDLDAANKALIARGKKGLDLAKLFGSVEAVNAVASLTDQVGLLESTTQNAVDSAGAASKAFNTIAQEDAFKAAQVQAKIQQTRIDLGESVIPVLADLAETLAPIAKDVAGWVKNNPELVRQIATLAIGAGALATALAPVVLAVSAVTTTMTLLRAATKLTDIAAKALIRTRQKEQVETGKAGAASASAAGNAGKLAGRLGAFAGIALEVISIIRSAQDILAASRGIEEQRTKQRETIQETRASAAKGREIVQNLSGAELAAFIQDTKGSKVGLQDQTISGSLLNSFSFGLAGQGPETVQTVKNLDRALAVQEVARRQAAGTLKVEISIDSSERATVESLQQQGFLPMDVDADVGPAF